MKALRKIFSIFCAAGCLNLLVLACVYLFVTSIDGLPVYAYQFSNLPNTNSADQSSVIVVEEVTAANGETQTKQFVETIIITSTGLTTTGLVEVPDSQKANAEDSQSLNNTNQIQNNNEVVEEAVCGQPLPDSVAAQMAQENYLKYSDDINTFVAILNEYRVSEGVEPLTLDYTLCLAAAHRSTENAWLDWFAIATIDGCTRHIRPYGKLASTIASYYNIPGMYSENIGRYQRTVKAVFADWQNSPSHNALLLSTANTKVGLGVAKDSHGQFYWTAIFN